MGNSQSSGEGEPPRSPATPPAQKRKDRERDVSQQRLRAAHAYTPPLAISSNPSTGTSTSYAQATVSHSPASSHSRNRSTTTSASKTRSDGLAVSSSPMGGAESKLRPPSRSSTLPPHDSEKPQSSPSSQPVDVPHPSSHDGLNEKDDLNRPTSSSPFGLPPSNFSRPPRLPLPIGRDPEPTSPLMSPQDIKAPVEQDEVDLPKRPSLLSSTTLDDDAADIEQFAMESDPLAQKVPIVLTWNGDARAVYVTGTFANWEKKFRMHKNQDGVFAATIPLTAGTHHITFLVDGEPVTSHDMPTTVDFANALVNYIEVIAPRSPTPEKQPPAPVEPVPIPGATETAHDIADPIQSPEKSLDIRTEGHAPELSSTLQETIAPAPGVQEQPHLIDAGTGPETEARPQQQTRTQPKTAAPLKQRLPRPKYTSEIPDLLLHLDLYNNPEDERYRRASKAIQQLPQPPSLPMFMSKSILNATTPHKDDASVLTMPNHTVLNHLATSSIRNGVLATSGTTRYKRKVCIFSTTHIRLYD